jgi:hypothetical protein
LAPSLGDIAVEDLDLIPVVGDNDRQKGRPMTDAGWLKLDANLAKLSQRAWGGS